MISWILCSIFKHKFCFHFSFTVNVLQPWSFGYYKAMAKQENGTNVTTISLFWETTLSYYVGEYCTLTIGIIGLITNTLTFIVFRQFKPQTGTTLYLQSLAVAYLISLFWDAIAAIGMPSLGVNIESSSYWACKIFAWQDLSSSTVASWSLLAVAWDRFILLNFPVFHKIHCARRRSMIVIFCMWFVTYSYCSPLMYFYELSVSDGCAVDPATIHVGLKFITFITYGLYFSIPFVGIIVANLSIMKLLYVRKKNRANMGIDETNSDDVSFLLVADCLMFLVFTGIVATLWALAWAPPSDDHQKAVFHLMFVVAKLIDCIEQSMSFFLYLVCSKVFRRILFDMIGYRKSTVVPI